MFISRGEIHIYVASAGKVATKPRGCNCSHIPEALEHPTEN